MLFTSEDIEDPVGINGDGDLNLRNITMSERNLQICNKLLLFVRGDLPS